MRKVNAKQPDENLATPSSHVAFTREAQGGRMNPERVEAAWEMFRVGSDDWMFWIDLEPYRPVPFKRNKRRYGR